MPRFVLLGILALPGASLAASLPTVAVVGLHQEGLTPDQQRHATDDIAAAIDDTGFFRARTLDMLEPVLQGRQEIVLEEAFLGPGRALLDDGRLLYNQAQPDEAIPVLEDAVETLRLAMATATSTRDLWEAWFLLGAARSDAGKAAEAREAFEAAVAVNPVRTADAARFPPSLVERYEAIRKEREQLASVLTVEADERDTSIWLNGSPRGTVPLEVDDVVPGENYIHARSPHGFFAYEAITVPEAGRKAVSLRLGEPTLGLPADSRAARQRQVSGLYRALGHYAGVDLVLLAGTIDDQLVLQLYSPRTNGFSEPLSIPYGGVASDEAVEALSELLAGVRDDATFEEDNRAALAAPLDVGANHFLARMLILTSETPGLEPDKKKFPVWATAVLVGVGVAAVAGATAGGISYALTDPHQGQIVIDLP